MPFKAYVVPAVNVADSSGIGPNTRGVAEAIAEIYTKIATGGGHVVGNIVAPTRIAQPVPHPETYTQMESFIVAEFPDPDKTD